MTKTQTPHSRITVEGPSVRDLDLPDTMPRYLVLSTGVSGFTVEAIAYDLQSAHDEFFHIHHGYVCDGMFDHDDDWCYPPNGRRHSDEFILLDTTSDPKGEHSMRLWLIDLLAASNVKTELPMVGIRSMVRPEV